MIDELKRELTKLGHEFKPQCELAAGRLVARIAVADWRRFIEFANRENTLAFTRLRCLTAAKGEQGLEVIAELVSPYWPEILSVRAVVNPKKKLPSLARLWPYADWLEWEMRDLYGIETDGDLPERMFLGALAQAPSRAAEVEA